MRNPSLSMHTFHNAPLVVRRSSYSSRHIEISMLNGLPDWDRQNDLTLDQSRPYDDYWLRHQRTMSMMDMASRTVCIGSVMLHHTELEDFVDLFKQVGGVDQIVRVERFVKLPFSYMPWNYTTVYEPTMQARTYGRTIEFAESVVLSIGSDPVLFVEGC